MDMKSLTEQDIRSKFISPAILTAGLDGTRQVAWSHRWTN
jgi:hypothetical protein